MELITPHLSGFFYSILFASREYSAYISSELKTPRLSKKAVTMIIGGLLLVIAILFYLLSRAQDEANSWRSANDAAVEAAQFWHNKDGSHQAEVKSIYASNSVINLRKDSVLQEAQTKIKGLQKNLKNLQSFVSITSHTTGQVSTVLRDTVFVTPGQAPIGGKSFAYSDHWSNISGYFLRDSVQVKYDFYDSIRIVQFWKRDGLFKPRVLYTDVISENPHTTLTGVRSTVARPPVKSRFGVGPFFGVDTSGKLSFGIGVQYTLFQF